MEKNSKGHNLQEVGRKEATEDIFMDTCKSYGKGQVTIPKKDKGTFKLEMEIMLLCS